MNHTILTTSIGALAAAFALAACSPRDQTVAENRTAEASRNVGNTTAKAADRAGDKVNDAMITTGVKAELAKDTSLSALAINVDTDNGRVTMNGPAPSAAAREKATTLAQGVKGVVSVDNKLVIGAK